MGRILPGEGLARTEIDTPFRETSFSSYSVEAGTSRTPVISVLPDVNVLKIPLITYEWWKPMQLELRRRNLSAKQSLMMRKLT